MTDAERYADEIGYLLRPENESERVIRAHLDRLLPTASPVLVGNKEQLLATGSKVGECHRNCMRYVKPGRQEHVMGWTVTDHLYFAHSVVRDLSDGSLHCVTPDHMTHLSEGEHFSFIDDPCFGLCNRGGMQWRDASVLVNHHDGANMRAIRRDVAMVIEHYDSIQKRLLAGEISYEDAMALGF